MLNIRNIFLRAGAGLVIMAAVVYAGDYLALRFRNPSQRFGSVLVQPYYAIAEKNNKTQFLSADPQPLTCVHALFPHMGYNPCWYVSRHTDLRIDE